MKSATISVLLLFLICLFTLSSQTAWGVPAAPIVHELKQPDGTKFKARQWGDEWVSGWETDEGYAIIHDHNTGDWSYAGQDDKGNLIPSRKRVGRDHPAANMKKHLRPSGDALKRRPNQAPPPAAPATATGSGGALAVSPPSEVQRSGTAKIPTILANFSDTTTTYTPQNFADLLYSTGTWSLKDFYYGASNGQYTVDPGTGVIGWVSAPGAYAYYGQDGTATDHNGVSRTAKDLWVGDLVWDAVAAADATVDFSQYDNDGDCVVDVVMIAHQGDGQETSGNTNHIWSKSWSLQGASFYGQSTHPYSSPNYGAYETNDYCTVPGRTTEHVTVDKFVIQPETNGANMTAVGVYVHEFGHYLGIPDLYDTDYTSAGAGKWTVMAGGSWNGVTLSGDRPAQLDAWSRYFLGWVTPTKLTASVAGKTFQAVESSNDIYQFLDGHPGLVHTGGVGEYFLVENRQLTGFDAALPGPGLLLWHVDEAQANNTQEWYPGCVPSDHTCNPHYKVALIQADGLYTMEHSDSRGDSTDPFFGGGGNRTVGHGTSPMNDLYSGADSGFALACISPSASTMTADIYFGGLPNANLTITKAGSGSGTVTGSAGGVSCGSTCGATFPVCSNVTLTATPDSGYYFGGWSGGGCGGIGTCIPTLTADQEIIATFVPPVAGSLATETFDSSSAPTGWTVVDNWSPTGHAIWRFQDLGGRGNLTGGSGNFAIADSVYVGQNGLDTELRTPARNFTGATLVTLAFKTYVRRNGTSNTFFADVDVSVNGAAGPWTNVWRRTEQNSSAQATVSLDISSIAANNSNVMIRFHYYSNLFPFYWAVDDVSVVALDTQAPDTAITAQPANPSNSGSGSFSFSSPDTSATFECSVDGTSYAACTSPYSFSALSDGSHTFTVRAKDASGNTDPTPASYTWTINTMVSTTTGVSSDVNPSISGQTVTFTATVTPGTATGTVTFKDGTDPLGAGTLSGGTATFSTSALSVGGHSITAVYPGDGGHSGSTSSILTQNVNAPPLDHFSVAITSPQTAGTPFSMTVTARDASNNTVTGYTGTVHFTSTDALAVLPADYTFTGGDNGARTFTGVALKTAGSQTVTATDATAAKSGTSEAITIAPGAAVAFTVTAPPSGTAGAPFDLTVTARDQFNNVAAGYSGTIHFTTTDSHAGITLPSDFTFGPSDNGAHTFSGGAALETAGNQTITATDTTSASINGTSGSIAISPAAATLFTVTAPATATAGSPFDITVTAKDNYDNIVTGYIGAVHFTSTDTGAGVVLPADYTFVAGDNGSHIFTSGVTLVGAGNRTVTATDTVTAATNGTSGSIAVGAASASRLAFTVQPATTVALQTITPAVKVEVRDAYGNTVIGAIDTVTLSIGTNPAGGTLGGTTSQPAVDGVATFDDLSIDRFGTGYRLAAGSGPLTAATSDAFNITAVSQEIGITTPAPANATYGANFTVAASAPGGAISYGSAGGCSNIGAVFTMTSGTTACTVKYDQPGNGSYNAASQKTQTVTAQKAVLTITANNATRSYGDANPAFTFTPTGFVGGDNSAVLSGSPSLTTTATTTSPVGDYTITAAVGTLAAANYSFSFVNGTLTIIKATPAITWGNPDGIIQGTPLGATQLNASAGQVAGTYTYTPAAGTVLGAGAGQSLSVDFTPTDTTNYNKATKTVLINVLNVSPANVVRVDPAHGFYTSIVNAYAGASSGSDIKACALAFSGELDLKLGTTVSISGGYNADQSAIIGMTSVTGPVTIETGQITLSNIVIK